MGLLPGLKKESHGLLARFFAWFNRMFASGSNFYVRVSGGVIRKSVVAVVALAGFAIAAGFFAKVLPSSFLPDEDQGYMYIQMQLPEASSLQASSEAARAVEDVLKSTPGVKYCNTVTGFSLLSLTRTSYNSFFFVTLEPWEDRKKIEEQYQVIKAKLNLKLITLPQGTTFAFSTTCNSGGRYFGWISVRARRPFRKRLRISKNLTKFLEAARKRPESGWSPRHTYRARRKSMSTSTRRRYSSRELTSEDVYTTLQAFMGGQFVNYFNQFGRTFQVYVGSRRALTAPAWTT